MRQTQQKLLGIIGQQDGASFVLRQRDQLGLGLTRHHDGAGTRLDGTGSKIIAVDVFTGKGDENRPFLDLTRVDNAPAAYPIGFSRHGSGPCCGREVVDGDLYHCSSPVNLIMLSAYCIPAPHMRGAGHVNTLIWDNKQRPKDCNPLLRVRDTQHVERVGHNGLERHRSGI